MECFLILVNKINADNKSSKKKKTLTENNLSISYNDIELQIKQKIGVHLDDSLVWNNHFQHG